MLGTVVVVVALIAFGVATLVGGLVTLLGSILIVRRKFALTLALKVWVAGALPAALLWAGLAVLLAEMPSGRSGPPSGKDWSDFIGAVALWAALPGAGSLGGGAVQIGWALLGSAPRDLAAKPEVLS